MDIFGGRSAAHHFYCLEQFFLFRSFAVKNLRWRLISLPYPGVNSSETEIMLLRELPMTCIINPGFCCPSGYGRTFCGDVSKGSSKWIHSSVLCSDTSAWEHTCCGGQFSFALLSRCFSLTFSEEVAALPHPTVPNRDVKNTHVCETLIFIYLAAPELCGMWTLHCSMDLVGSSSLTRDWTQAPCTGSSES